MYFVYGIVKVPFDGPLGCVFDYTHFNGHVIRVCTFSCSTTA